MVVLGRGVKVGILCIVSIGCCRDGVCVEGRGSWYKMCVVLFSVFIFEGCVFLGCGLV